MLTNEQIAQLCHEANRAYCCINGDASQPHWSEAPKWQRSSAIEGVEFAIANPDAPASAQHDSWLAQKTQDGWVYGEVKDAEKKTHPCCVPYGELPEYQRRKDALFKAIVSAMTSPED